jgi:hypothetical protein
MSKVNSTRYQRPSDIQQRILRAMHEDGCRIRKSFTECTLYDPRGYSIQTVKPRTFVALVKAGWVESDRGSAPPCWRLSAKGERALSNELVRGTTA